MTISGDDTRFLQTVMRDRAEDKGNASYRYDLLADGERQAAAYIVRAYKSVASKGGHILRERTSVAEPLYGEESAVRKMFLHIAHADQPVDPLHLGDVLKDCGDDNGVDSSDMRECSEGERYYDYDPSLE